MTGSSILRTILTTPYPSVHVHRLKVTIGGQARKNGGNANEAGGENRTSVGLSIKHGFSLEAYRGLPLLASDSGWNPKILLPVPPVFSIVPLGVQSFVLLIGRCDRAGANTLEWAYLG